ncbi:uncharacterized protein LOC133320135 [Danaus plexippus]|uniref:uncharacterized protein LOC133320135 n=1 Tax=Danaus plexippus TaxID=13037 RepID=UPI002AB0EFA9|nr:uncharacterized protein LOC133320135 [Danaus plexippus]
MPQILLQIALLLSCLIIAANCGLEILPERAKLVSFNEKYFSNFSLNLRRFSRTTPFYYNVELTTKQTWTNNVTVHVIFNEYLHNEYRRSFIEFHRTYCDMVKYDKFIGPTMHKVGLLCPHPVETLRVINFTFPMNTFPNVFPFEKSRIDTELTVTATNESMVLLYHYVTIRNLP